MAQDKRTTVIWVPGQRKSPGGGRGGLGGRDMPFSRTGGADTGDFDDPVILASHGDVPEVT